MLFGLQTKYWDKIDTPPLYGKTKVINEGWCLQRKSSSLLKYKYSKNKLKKRYEPIELDLLIGELKFQIKNDTIIIAQLDSKVLIKKITKDTLIVHDINGGFIGDAIFIKSKDQKQKIEPAIKMKRDKASAYNRAAYNRRFGNMVAGRC